MEITTQTAEKMPPVILQIRQKIQDEYIKLRNIETYTPDPISEQFISLYTFLCYAFGQEVTNENVHNAWMIIINDINHKSMQPYGFLDAETQEKDTPYTEMIKKVARDLKVLNS
jgi:hypothetical protein